MPQKHYNSNYRAGMEDTMSSPRVENMTSSRSPSPTPRTDELETSTSVNPLLGIRISHEELFSQDEQNVTPVIAFPSATATVDEVVEGQALSPPQSQQADSSSFIALPSATATVEEVAVEEPTVEEATVDDVALDEATVDEASVEETTGGQPPSQALSQVPESESESRVATPRPNAAGEYDIEGMPPRFPSRPPPGFVRLEPIGVSRGPASSPSLSSYNAPLNPSAPAFAPANPAAAMLRRGPPPGTRDLGDIPNDPATGEVMADPALTHSRWLSAARHAAMVYKRLLDADSVIVANDLNRHFTHYFGRDYDDEVVRLIAEDSGARPSRATTTRTTMRMTICTDEDSTVSSKQERIPTRKYIGYAR